MPSSSKAQQRFFGVVKAIQKGDKPATGKAGKAADSMSKDDVDKYASTKHKGLPNKVKREMRVKNLIKKLVREIMAEMKEGGPGSGPQSDDDNPFDREPSDDELKDIEKQFEGKLTETKFYAFFNRKKYTIDGKSLYDAKQKAITKLKIPKSKVGLLAIVNAKEHDRGGYRFEGKLNEKPKVQRYVVGLENGEVMSGDKSVTEKRALQIMSRISKRSDGWVNPFMIGVEAWNGTHPKSKGKPHKMNKKKIMVKEACQKGYKTHPTRKTKEMFGKRYRNCIKAEDKINERMDRRKAAVLLKQLGGNRFIAMTGAKDFAFSNKYMSFKIGRNSKGINFVRIAHNAKDLYDMEFGFVSVRGIKVKKKVKDVYADMLGQMFKKYTGMNVRL